MTTEDPRAAYVQGLLMLASLLEEHEELPLPYEGSASDMTFHFLGGGDPRAAMAAAARALPVTWRKDALDGDGASYFELRASLAGLRIKLTAYRDAVCTRVVTGTREVTEEVPDPDMLAAVPRVEITRTVEDVSWDCEPLMTAGGRS